MIFQMILRAVPASSICRSESSGFQTSSRVSVLIIPKLPSVAAQNPSASPKLTGLSSGHLTDLFIHHNRKANRDEFWVEVFAIGYFRGNRSQNFRRPKAPIPS
jgi:hypothetical protein